MNHDARTGPHRITPRRHVQPPDSRFEWRLVEIARDVTRAETRVVLTEQAEYGRWELVRSQVLVGGARRVWLRRRVMNVRRSDAA